VGAHCLLVTRDIIFWGVSDPLCLSSSLAIPFFQLVLSVSTILLTCMMGIYLHRQWPPTSHSHGSFVLKRTIVFSLQIKLIKQIKLRYS
jgi:hypothetical protein